MHWNSLLHVMYQTPHCTINCYTTNDYTTKTKNNGEQKEKIVKNSRKEKLYMCVRKLHPFLITFHFSTFHCRFQLEGEQIKVLCNEKHWRHTATLEDFIAQMSNAFQTQFSVVEYLAFFFGGMQFAEKLRFC